MPLWTHKAPASDIVDAKPEIDVTKWRVLVGLMRRIRTCLKGDRLPVSQAVELGEERMKGVLEPDVEAAQAKEIGAG